MVSAVSAHDFHSYRPSLPRFRFTAATTIILVPATTISPQPQPYANASTHLTYSSHPLSLPSLLRNALATTPLNNPLVTLFRWLGGVPGETVKDPALSLKLGDGEGVRIALERSKGQSIVVIFGEVRVMCGLSLRWR